MGSYSPEPPPPEQMPVQAAAEPEYLSPDPAYIEAPQPVRRERPSWSYAPATYLLVGINCVVFLAMAANHVSTWSPSPGDLMNWGANNAGSVLVQGQWWRIVTAMFVHGGIIHLATNMWCLWNLGLLAEPLLGSAGVLAVYILTGAAGNLLSTLKSWWTAFAAYPDLIDLAKKYHGPVPADQLVGLFPPGVGASGAVFGIAGALIVLLKSRLLPVPPQELHKLRMSVIYFAALNLMIPFAVDYGAQAMHSGFRIDNMAHLGGFSCGLLFAAPLVPRFGSPRRLFQERLRIAVAMVVGILVLFGFYLTKVAG